MLLAPGQRFAWYEVLTPLGAGGMAEVYRALDTRLGRTVALKLLSQDIADVHARRRFQLEAQSASSLSHPNIVTVFDVGEHQGRQYLVLEYIDGGTLREWLAERRRGWSEAIELLLGIADGLERAHAVGILHRDVKPANILLCKDGRAKLADFGIAKLVERDPERRADGPHETMTSAGVILGTIPYMSPEQAAGHSIDARSDVFSLGVVLYEALLGRRPFEGSCELEVLQRILYDPPDPVDSALPAELRIALEKALEKDPAVRYQTVRELAVDLRRALRTLQAGSAHGPRARTAHAVRDPTGPARTLRLRAGPVAALAVGVVGAFAWHATRAEPPARVLRERRLTELVGMEERPALSPNGGHVAFVALLDGLRQIWVRDVRSGAPLPLTAGPNEHTSPRWVDGGTLVFFQLPLEGERMGSLWEQVVLSAAQARFLTESENEADVSHDRLATVASSESGPLLALIERGGARGRDSIPLPPGTYTCPRWSPDGGTVALLAVGSIGASSLVLVDTKSGGVRTFGTSARISGFAWLPDGSGLVCASAKGSTLAYPPTFGLHRLDVRDGTSTPLPVTSSSYASYSSPDVSRGDRLVACRTAQHADIYRFPVDGTAQENTARAERVTRQTGHVQVPSVDPTGERVVYVADSGGRANLWIARADGTGHPQQLTHETDPEVVVGLPLWSPSGDLIVYVIEHKGRPRPQLWLTDTEGRSHRFLADGAGASWSKDGAYLYYHEYLRDASHVARTVRVPIDGGDHEPVREGIVGLQVTADGSKGFFMPSVHRQGEVWWASPVETGEPVLLRGDLQDRIPLWPHHYHLSDDDQWLAAPLRDGCTTNLYAISTADGELWQITDFGERATTIGRQVAWSQDGAWIYAAVLETDADVVLLEGIID